jgi:sialate O-acetylesterase
LTLVSGVDTITASEVVFGDVILCTGQSNMEKTVSYSAAGAEQIPLADHPWMRLFQHASVACGQGRLSFHPVLLL